MQLVLLAGELGEKYGQKHEYYNLQTPADAIKLLCINYPALKNDLMQAHQNGVGYKVIQGGAAMNYDELLLPFGSKPLLVVPVITGSGGANTRQILLGVGLVGASFLLPGAGLFGATGLFGAGAAGVVGVSSSAVLTATTIGTALSAVGAGMILGGVANLISPQPQLPKADRIKGEGSNVRGPGPDGITRGASGNQSYAFTGPANTVGTGTTLPVIYGRVTTGSHLIAANLEVTDNSDPLQIATQEPGLRTVKVNSEKLTRKLKSHGGIQGRRFDTDAIQGTNRDERIFANKIFGPKSNHDKPLKIGSKITIDDPALKYKRNETKRKKIDVIFKIRNGLHDFVNKKGTTKIDGFITIQLTAAITTGDDDDIDVASARFTLQGLTNRSQNLVFGVRLEAPRVGTRANEDLDLIVEIVDVGCHDEATLDVQGYGYGLLDPL